MAGTLALLGSTAGLVGVVLVIGVIKGWIRLGSALVGVLAGTMLGAAISGQVRSLVNGGVTSASAWLHRVAGSVTVLGVRPADWISTWGWSLIVGCLLVVLVVGPLVMFLDGGRKNKAKASS